MYQDFTMTDRHSIRLGAIEIRYYVREPSPDQWNAVGVIYATGKDQTCADRCPLVVGVGSTYYEAIGDLIARTLRGDHPDLPKHIIEREVSNRSLLDGGISRPDANDHSHFVGADNAVALHR